MLKNKINLVLESIIKSKSIMSKTIKYIIITFIILYILSPYVDDIQDKKTKKADKLKIIIICFIIGLFIFGVEMVNLITNIFSIAFG